MEWIILLVQLWFIVLHAQGQRNCKTTPLKFQLQVGGGKVEYCEYQSNAGSSPVEIFPGSEFMTKDCSICKCSDTGLECCEKRKTPNVSNIPRGCLIVLDGCDFQVVSADDRTKECITGKPITKKDAQLEKILPVDKKSINTNDMLLLLKLLTKLNQNTKQGIVTRHNNFLSKMSPVPYSIPFQNIQNLILRSTRRRQDGEPTFMDFLHWYNSRGRMSNGIMSQINRGPSAMMNNRWDSLMNSGLRGMPMDTAGALTNPLLSMNSANVNPFFMNAVTSSGTGFNPQMMTPVNTNMQGLNTALLENMDLI